MEERKISWLELFYDLIFVVAISSTNEILLEVEQHQGSFYIILFKYLLMVVPMWWAWSGQTMFLNRFGEKQNNEIPMIMQIFFVIVMVASFNLDFDKTYLSFIIGYTGIRLITIIQYLVYYYKTKEECDKKIAKVLAGGMSFSLLLSVSSLFFDESIRYIILYSGIVIDIIIPLFNGNILKKVPIHLGHLIERISLLCMITFGEAIVSIVLVLNNHTFDIETIIYLIIVFLTLVAMWFSYFYKADKLIDKTTLGNGQLILYSSLFIIIAVMIFSDGIRLVYDDRINHKIVNNLLLISYMIFLIFKNIIFLQHKK